MKFSLRQIAIFAAIARCGSVSQAAERLAMSQSAASNALLELERAYERPLFDRIGKSLHLNSDGRGLLPSAERLLGLAADIDSLLAGDRPGPLAVGATLTIGNYLATLLVADYLRQNPDSPATLHVANTHQIIASLLAFDCDLGLIEGEVSHPDLHCEPWLEDELLVFCAPGHPLAAAGRADNATLAAQDWILREPGSGTREQFERQVARQLPRVQTRLELEHTEAIKRAVESGLGIGCLSRLALREALRRGSLVEIATPQFALRRHFYLACHRQRHESLAMRRFRELCARFTAGARDTGELVLPFIP